MTTPASDTGKNVVEYITTLGILAMEGLGEWRLGNTVQLRLAIGQGTQGMLGHGGIVDQFQEILVRLRPEQLLQGVDRSHP